MYDESMDKYPKWTNITIPGRSIADVVEENMLEMRLTLYMSGCGYTNDEINDEVKSQINELRAKRLGMPPTPAVKHHRNRDDFLRDVFGEKSS